MAKAGRRMFARYSVFRALVDARNGGKAGFILGQLAEPIAGFKSEGATDGVFAPLERIS